MEKVTGTWTLKGDALKAVNEKIKEVKDNECASQYGKERAINSLLCELYKIKHSSFYKSYQLNKLL